MKLNVSQFTRTSLQCFSDAIMRTFYGEWDQSADVPIVANYMVLNYGLHVFSIEIFIIRIAQSKFWLNLCFRSLKPSFYFNSSYYSLIWDKILSNYANEGISCNYILFLAINYICLSLSAYFVVRLNTKTRSSN